MRHRKDGRQFGRNTSHRRAMLRNLAANLINHERIVTTDAKAKELRRVAERLISKAKRLGKIAYSPLSSLDEKDRARRLHVKRLLQAYLPRVGGENKRDLVEKILVELSQRFATRAGGYTRIMKLGNRRGDGAPLSIIEFVDAVLKGGTEDGGQIEAEEAEATSPDAEKAESAEGESSEAADDASTEEESPSPSDEEEEESPSPSDEEKEEKKDE